MNSETLLTYLQSLPRGVLEDHYMWMLDTLTTTQDRCTKLLTEVRELRLEALEKANASRKRKFSFEGQEIPRDAFEKENVRLFHENVALKAEVGTLKKACDSYRKDIEASEIDTKKLRADLQKLEIELKASKKEAAGWKESYHKRLKTDLLHITERTKRSKEAIYLLRRLKAICSAGEASDAFDAAEHDPHVESEPSRPSRWVVMCSAPGIILGYWRGDFGSKEEAQALIDVYSRRTTTNYSMTPVPLTPEIESYGRLSPDDG